MLWTRASLGCAPGRRPGCLSTITRELTAQRLELAGIQTERIGKGRYEIELDLRPPPLMRADGVVQLVSALPDVELIESVSVVD